MSATVVALDDKILDGIKAKIETHRNADKALIAALNYNVERDRTAPLQDLSAPLVVIELDADTPDGRNYTARYKILCVVPTLNDNALAVARLSLLKEQVRRALLDHTGYDFGQAVGAIGKFTWPTWTPVSFDDRELDTTIIAGAWTMEVTYAYQPDELTAESLDEISATIGRFEAVYNFTGGTP